MRDNYLKKLEQMQKELFEMGMLCEEAIQKTYRLLVSEQEREELVKAIDVLEREIDAKERRIEADCIQLFLQQQPVARDLRQISAALKMITDLLEALTIFCFGLSWPMNAYKNFKARTAAGTSWQFILLITLGYFAGIAAKFVSGTINWVLVVYFINVVCIAANWVVYFRNCAIDRERDRLRKEEDAQDAMAQARAAR